MIPVTCSYSREYLKENQYGPNLHLMNCWCNFIMGTLSEGDQISVSDSLLSLYMKNIRSYG